MKKHAHIRLLAAIGLAMPVLAATSQARAQTQVNQDGRALDANPRVGTDGSNDRRNSIDRRGQTYTQNQIVTGNVTSGRSFRGPVPYRDPNEFSGPTSTFNSDPFVRGSVGAPTRSNPTLNDAPTAYYSRELLSTPPPLGFRSDGFTGGYFDTGAAQGTFTPRTPYARSTAQVFDSQNSLRTGLLVDGGLDQDNKPMTLWASPLTGVVPLNDTMLRNLAGSGLRPGDDAAQRDANRPITMRDIERMREELNDRGENQETDKTAREGEAAAEGAIEAQPLDNAVDSAKGGGTQSPGAAAASGRNQATSDDRQQQGNQLDNRLEAEPLGGKRGETQQGTQRTFIVRPSEQSKTYKELQKRFMAQQQTGAISGEDANRQLRQLRKAQDEGADAKPGAEQPGALPPPALPIPRKQATDATPKAAAPKAAVKPGAAKPAPTPAAAPKPQASRPAPLRIKSLAEGVEAKGLRELLSSAEQLMKEQKFTSAIEKYAAAEAVAPNNPLLRLGRAQAELGAMKYGSAEQHLREAVGADPALLMGQYDLESFIGRDRLSFLIKDLNQIASTEATAVRPLVLLAYIAYGMPSAESASAAAEYLDTASKRAGGPDPLINAMREHWVLPTTQPKETPKVEAPASPNK